ncbi:MAG: HEPN domain-containing protein [Planctomycetes bacterium]|nr:HEPN domain-containing protein [Planctomycetota bacterium]
MDRTQLKKIAFSRLRDAKSLLVQERWSGAYYFCGYTIECGLKACLLRHLGESAAIFGEAGYLKRLADCWTHDLDKLVDLAGLKAEFGVARGANPALQNFWSVIKDWFEAAR